MYTHARARTHTRTHVILFSTAFGTNFARHGVATHSSTHEKAFANKAIDGTVTGNYWAHSCSHTRTPNNNPWWKVTFKHNVLVTEVVLSNRADCCGKCLNGMVVVNNCIYMYCMLWLVGRGVKHNLILDVIVVISYVDVTGANHKVEIRKRAVENKRSCLISLHIFRRHKMSCPNVITEIVFWKYWVTKTMLIIIFTFWKTHNYSFNSNMKSDVKQLRR